ncbi:MAG: DDE-type integrase/transposase/recombinase, partial [Pseudomonadota bacterium]
RRNTSAALRFFRKLFKTWGQPRVIITNKLRSYGADTSKLTPGIEHRQNTRMSNRAEATHPLTRRREKTMCRFKSPGQAQRFQSVHDQTAALFRPKSHRLSAHSYRDARTDAFDLWNEYALQLAAGT